jgi:transcriptional regulator with XRE-family HTH domain
MSDSPGLDPELLNLPGLRVALFHRDVTTVYKILVRAGIPQRRIAELVDQSQSEVSEIINGRQVMGYDLLVRICEGLGIPRGAMGLAYDEAADSAPLDPPGEEDDVERRNFLAIAGAILFGTPVFGDPPLDVARCGGLPTSAGRAIRCHGIRADRCPTERTGPRVWRYGRSRGTSSDSQDRGDAAVLPSQS